MINVELLLAYHRSVKVVKAVSEHYIGAHQPTAFKHHAEACGAEKAAFVSA